MQSKTTGKFLLDADENINIANYILNNIDPYIYNMTCVLPESYQIDQTISIEDIFKPLTPQFVFSSFPTNNVLQRYHFDANFYYNLLKNNQYDVIINNVDTNSRNIRAILENLKSSMKLITFVHFIDLPSKYVTTKMTSYFRRQIDSALASDCTWFLSKLNLTNFLLEAVPFVTADEYMRLCDTCIVMPLVFSDSNLRSRIATANTFPSLHGNRKTVIFPNRLSENNYTHHVNFIGAVNNVYKKIDFDVYMTNPNEGISYDILEKEVDNIVFPFGKRRLNRSEYFRLLCSSDFIVALFRETHGGTACREAIYAGAIPIIPSRNDYLMLRDQLFYDMDFKMVDDDLSNLEEVLEYYLTKFDIENYRKKHLPKVLERLAIIESVEYNIPHFIHNIH